MPATRRLASRSRILEGARTILDDGVYSDLTVDNLARSLRMSKSTLYKYFRGKDDLICAIVEEACEHTEAAVQHVLADTPDPRSALDRIIDVLAERASAMPRSTILQASRLPGSCQDRLVEHRAAVALTIEGVLTSAARAGHLHVEHPRLAAVALMAAIDAAVLGSARADHDLGRETAVREAYALLKPGLGLTNGDTV